MNHFAASMFHGLPAILKFRIFPFQPWLTSFLFKICMQDVSKKKTSGSNGIPVEKSTRSKSKAKLKGAFSLVEQNNNTFKSKGKHLERTNSKTLLVFLFEKDSTSIHLTVSSGVSGPHMPKRYQRKDLSWRSKVTNNLFICLHFLV